MTDPRLVACDESPAYLTAMQDADKAAERFFEYEDFLRSKMITTAQFGIAIDPAEITTHFLEAAACGIAATFGGFDCPNKNFHISNGFLKILTQTRTLK